MNTKPRQQIEILVRFRGVFQNFRRQWYFKDVIDIRLITMRSGLIITLKFIRGRQI